MFTYPSPFQYSPGNMFTAIHDSPHHCLQYIHIYIQKKSSTVYHSHQNEEALQQMCFRNYFRFFPEGFIAVIQSQTIVKHFRADYISGNNFETFSKEYFRAQYLGVFVQGVYTYTSAREHQCISCTCFNIEGSPPIYIGPGSLSDRTGSRYQLFAGPTRPCCVLYFTIGV